MLLAAGAGLLAAFAALAFAELASVAVRPQAAPVTAVGEAAIDRTPAAVKDFAVQHFGTDDKLVLQLGILALLAGFAAVLGVVALRWRAVGVAGVLAFGALGAAAAASRPDAGTFDAVPSLVGALVGSALLYLLAGRLAWRSGPVGGEPPAAASAASAGVGVLGRALDDGKGASAIASRNDLVLPKPRSAAGPLPRGVDLDIPGLSPFTTPAADFYRVDTALVVPRIDATTWRLRIHGTGVAEELNLGFEDLLRRGLIERDITLTCVSNEVGGPYVGNARWIGVPLADLLREAGVRAPSQGGPADQLVARSVDGMAIGSPVETVLDGRDAMLAVGMNGRPLPFDHGFPVRMVVPGLYGYVSACKWLQDLELTTFADFDAYWVRRGWSDRAPIKTESRIDTPKPFARLAPGQTAVAGVAWAQHTGIERVEVRVDGGPWQLADLATQDTTDTWRQWVWRWAATAPGLHTLEVRATDRSGYTQTDQRVGTIPNGATGWHSVVVSVT
jgi:DMSO/TMAO reductase YedYZ molybdopterin-dependent catalytic subunit